MSDSLFSMRAVIVFKADELDEDSIKREFEDRGLNVDEVFDDTLTDGELVKAFLVSGDYAKMFRLKLDFNCWEQLDNPYIWYPMGDYTLEEFNQYQEMKKAARQS